MSCQTTRQLTVVCNTFVKTQPNIFNGQAGDLVTNISLFSLHLSIVILHVRNTFDKFLTITTSKNMQSYHAQSLLGVLGISENWQNNFSDKGYILRQLLG